ncbi:glycosyltransferase [Halorubrum californiense DSM 19288]|uniref:Glycosyltransferase n=1 Tax=Halorubrum californiense DSM 19288 TaxID=1227465 RepID=M0E2L1_9EURY|nr:glycosyltransferase [Halorubrum californiense DSM 19288]
MLIEELSDTNVELVHGILDQSAIYETFEACSPVSVREEFGVTSDDTLLVFVGRLTPTKNPGGAIDIMSTLPKEYQLVVVGDGEQRRALERIVHGSSLEEQVQFTGVLNHQEALSIIASADGLLVTSHVESYSAVTLEALALGTPVFGTSVGVLQYMDHERLYTGEMDDIPGIIKNSNFTGEFSIDKEIVEQYGMSTYTETILNGFQQSDPA